MQRSATINEQGSVEQKFARLTNEWKGATAHLSRADKIAMHPAYLQIIGMGPQALPWILNELQREPDHWFCALFAITGVDPIPETSRGNMNEMAQAWLDWGREHGHL